MSLASSQSAGPARKKLTPQELGAAMARHKAFLRQQSGGARAVFKLCDLSHLNLSNLDLSAADFTGAKLFSARLINTNLTDATLFGCDMRLANIWNATSMPTVKPSPSMTSKAPTIRMASVIACSNALAMTLNVLASWRVAKPALK